MKKKSTSDYDKILEGVNQDDAVPYSMNAGFQVRDLIDHKTFGLGMVMDSIKPDKIVVQFKEGQKILVCVLRDSP